MIILKENKKGQKRPMLSKQQIYPYAIEVKEETDFEKITSLLTDINTDWIIVSSHYHSKRGNVFVLIRLR